MNVAVAEKPGVGQRVSNRMERRKTAGLKRWRELVRAEASGKKVKGLEDAILDASRDAELNPTAFDGDVAAVREHARLNAEKAEFDNRRPELLRVQEAAIARFKESEDELKAARLHLSGSQWDVTGSLRESADRWNRARKLRAKNPRLWPDPDVE